MTPPIPKPLDTGENAEKEYAVSTKLLYVGTTRVDRHGENMGVAPKGTIGEVQVPEDVTVVGMYEAGGRLYVEWVCEV